MKRNIVIFGALVVVLAFLLVTGKYLGKIGASRVPKTTEMRGQAAPDFTLADMDGRKLQLSSLHGKAVILNFWATWCAPCQEEIPWFVDLQQRYGDKGLQIVGVALDDSGKDEINNFIRENKINYPVVIGEDEVADRFGGVPYLPTTFYIDRNGTVVERAYGLLDRKSMEQNVQKLVDEKTTSRMWPHIMQHVGAVSAGGAQ